jgi:hypothetical protein
MMIWGWSWQESVMFSVEVQGKISPTEKILPYERLAGGWRTVSGPPLDGTVR